MTSVEANEFTEEKHVGYLRQAFRFLPHHYQGNDVLRITLGYFGLLGLEVLGSLQNTLDEEKRRKLIDWIYAQQVITKGKGV